MESSPIKSAISEGGSKRSLSVDKERQLLISEEATKHLHGKVKLDVPGGWDRCRLSSRCSEVWRTVISQDLLRSILKYYKGDIAQQRRIWKDFFSQWHQKELIYFRKVFIHVVLAALTSLIVHLEIRRARVGARKEQCSQVDRRLTSE